MSAELADKLRKRQRCHDLRAQGWTLDAIQQGLAPVGRTTVREWLRRPRPTDEEVADAGTHKTDTTGQVGFKSRFDPELFARLRAEADQQGAATNKVIGCAARLYLDVMDRARAGGGEAVDVMGYRA